MALTDEFMAGDLHPIDLVENIAEHHQWDFDRIAEDQIAMAVEGQWRTYTLTLAWSEHEEALRLICTFELEPPKSRLPAVFETLNAINDQCWSGSFTFWEKQNLMVFRYGLLLAGGQEACADQVDLMIGAAVANAERYYPALQLVIWGDRSPQDAMQVAIAEAYGRA